MPQQVIILNFSINPIDVTFNETEQILISHANINSTQTQRPLLNQLINVTSRNHNNKQNIPCRFRCSLTVHH